MRRGRRALLLLLLSLCVLLLVGCKDEEDVSERLESSFADVSAMDFTFNGTDTLTEADASATRITLSDSGAVITGGGAVQNGNALLISAAGCYRIAGTLSDGTITVAASQSAKVHLIFEGLTLHSEGRPALYIKSADKVTVTLSEGTQNRLSDGTGYTLEEDGSTLDGVIFSRADLALNGKGALRVVAGNKHGVVSKDDLVVIDASLAVDAPGVCLAGKDCVKLRGAALTLSAGTDGIRSDNDEDAARGYIYIESGTYDIKAGNDAVQAETVLNIAGGEFTLYTGEGSENASYSQGGFNSMWGYYETASSTESMKGLKAGSDILLSGGVFVMDTEDDAIHSNGSIAITGGTFTLSSGDDGVHADTAAHIGGGTLDVLKSYEGLEASDILITGGVISLTASDDGINVAGGADASSMGARPGRNSFSATEGVLAISGGYTVVNASGDGLDSNGNIEISGGITLVSGPTNSANAAFDYDGSASVVGGVLIALGASGMAQGFSSAENQGAITVSFSAASAGESFALVDEEGNVILSFTPMKAYNSAVVTAPAIRKGGTYTLLSGAVLTAIDANGYTASGTATGGQTLATVTLTSNLYGSSSGGGMGGGMGGARPGRR